MNLKWPYKNVVTFTKKIGFKASPISGGLFSLFFSTGYVLLAFQFKSHSMKAGFKDRIYPTLGQNTDQQGSEGCVRVVWNDSLACSGGKVQMSVHSKNYTAF